MSLSKQILLALAAGVAIGLFFGDKVAFLEIGGRAFIQLLQITVLPYVAGSLIAGFGSMRREDARLLARRGALLLLVLWALALGLVFLQPLTLPSGKGGAFFSFPGLEGEHPIDWLDLYIPANPFRSLANNVVPAVVVLPSSLGWGSWPCPARKTLLGPLHCSTTPWGASGASSPASPPRHIRHRRPHRRAPCSSRSSSAFRASCSSTRAFACLLTFWLLPGLVAAAHFGQPPAHVSLSQDALVTAFVTSNLFIVLPLLVERSQHPALRAAGEGRQR